MLRVEAILGANHGENTITHCSSAQTTTTAYTYIENGFHFFFSFSLVFYLFYLILFDFAFASNVFFLLKSVYIFFLYNITNEKLYCVYCQYVCRVPCANVHGSQTQTHTNTRRVNFMHWRVHRPRISFLCFYFVCACPFCVYAIYFFFSLIFSDFFSLRSCRNRVSQSFEVFFVQRADFVVDLFFFFIFSFNSSISISFSSRDLSQCLYLLSLIFRCAFYTYQIFIRWKWRDA